MRFVIVKSNFMKNLNLISTIAFLLLITIVVINYKFG
jgi:hypothetical protein